LRGHASDVEEDLEADGRIILKCVSKKLDLMMWTRFIWFRIGTSVGTL
jgi:hypothetical protein